MTPPIWKLVLLYPEGAEFSTRQLKSEVCPCKCCWCETCGRKWLQDSIVSTVRKFLCTNQCTDSLEPPLWKLVVMFEEGSTFISRQFGSDVGLCRYCWCGNCGSAKFEESDLFTFCKFFSPEAENSLQQLLKRNNELSVSQKGTANLGASIADVNATSKTLQLLEPVPNFEQFLESQFQDAMDLMSQATTADDKNKISETQIENVLLNQDQNLLVTDVLNQVNSPEPLQHRSGRKFRNKISMAVNERGGSDHEDEQGSDDSGDPTWSDVLEPVNKRSRRKATKVRQAKALSAHSGSTKHNDQNIPQVKAESSPNPQKCQQNSAKKSRTLKKKKLCCLECFKPFTTMRELQLHMEEHKPEEERRHKCDMCAKSFRYHMHLKDHKRTHTGERPHKCDQCSKSFSMPHHLKYHIMSFHTGERPHQCNQCSNAYVNVYKLRLHQRKWGHSGQVPR